MHDFSTSAAVSTLSVQQKRPPPPAESDYAGTTMTNEELLAEIEDVLRSMPERERLHVAEAETLMWVGRAGAIMDRMGMTYSVPWEAYAPDLQGSVNVRWSAANRLIALLHKARYALLLTVQKPKTLAVQAGGVFDYYDGLRAVIEQAATDILFVDPYLDAEFVSRYLPNVKRGAAIRLLAREKLPTLMPAVRLFSQQTGAIIEVRSAPGFHDRFVFVDKAACYQSSGSFKDGGRKSPVVITPLADALGPLLATYENIWMGAKVEA